ncbi:MAG: hypothetical protein A2Y61_04235 [Chloroflexi bacterium RBG_13_60_13]|nr:MAG: hypothetical protein A2Y61_04235 [Chloroflexi bacterium RBG_13_60_13]
MNLKALDLKWALAFAGAVAVAIAATLLTLALVDNGREQATAQGGPTPTPTVAETALPTVDVTSAPPSATETPMTTATPRAGEGLAERCPAGWVLHDYPNAGYSVCIPPDWVIIDYSGKEAEGNDINIFDPDLAPWAGKPTGGTVPGGVKMGIRVKPASEPYDRSTFDDPTKCSTHIRQEISARQVDVCTAKATDPRMPEDRFAPGEEKSVGWVFPSVNGATLVAGALFDSPVSAEDEATIAEIVGSIEQ